MNGNELKVGDLTIGNTIDRLYRKITGIDYEHKRAFYDFGEEINYLESKSWADFCCFKDNSIKVETCPTCGAELRKK